MKTSLLILCASFAIAASTAFNEFKADGTALFLVVECKESVELDIAIVKSKYGLLALIEDNSSCDVFSWSQMDNGHVSKLTDVADARSIEFNRSKIPIYYGETLTCKTFGIYLPAPTKSEQQSKPIVECYAL